MKNEVKKYLSFKIGVNEFAFDLKSILQVVRSMNLMPAYDWMNVIEGIIVLNEKAVPIVDLRERFGYSGNVDDTNRIFMIVSIRAKTKEVTVGLCVDAICEVFELEEGQIRKAKDRRPSPWSKAMCGVAKVMDKTIGILDVQKLFSEEELGDIMKACGSEY